MAPSIEERLSAAAYRILSDGRRHHFEAERWARMQIGYDPLLTEETGLSHEEQICAVREGQRRRRLSLGFRKWANQHAEAAL